MSSQVHRTNVNNDRDGHFGFIFKFTDRVYQTDVKSRLQSATGLRVQASYHAQKGEKAGGDMKKLFGVRGNFTSTHEDAADMLFARVHCQYYKVMFESTEEKLKVNKEHQQTLYDEISELKAKIPDPEATATTEATKVGEKRPRTDDELVDKLEKIQQMLNGTVMQDLRDDNAELKAELKKVKNENDGLKEQLRKARSQRDAAEGKLKRLAADNEKKVTEHEKLRVTAKKSSVTMGFGTRVWATFLDLKLTTKAGVKNAIKLQAELRRTIAKVSKNKYLELKDHPPMQPFDQPSITAYVQAAGLDDEGEEEEEMPNRHNESEDEEP